jgi:membrane protein implicated in regulation of membrane protease activity
MLVQILWICIIAYAVASLNVIIMALLTYNDAPGAYLNPQSSLTFAIVSFLLVVVVSAYHISTLVRRRKRRTDKRKLSLAKQLRARHNAARKKVRELVSVILRD